MGKKFDFDYIVVGSGAAGRTVALRLAEGNKQVALVTGAFFGGSVLSTKHLGLTKNLEFADSYYKIKTSSAVDPESLHLNLGTLGRLGAKEVEKAQKNWREKLELSGVTIFKGTASLKDNHTVAIKNQKIEKPEDLDAPTTITKIEDISARNLILATGTKPRLTEIEGLDSVDYLTPNSALKLEKPPRFVLIVGGGETGVELASYFARLGVRVLVMEKLERLLPREDEEVGRAVAACFKEELDVMVVTGAKVIRLEQDLFSKRVVFMADNTEKVVRVDSVVLATGSEPVLDYGLAKAKVKYRRSGIVVNPYFNTSVKNIFALGSAIDSPLRHSPLRSTLEAEVLAANLLRSREMPVGALKGRGGRLLPNYASLPRRIQAAPEITIVGMNEHDLESRNLNFRRTMIPAQDFLSSSYAPGKYGLIKLLTSRGGELYGASIVGSHAEALAAELTLAVREKMPIATVLPFER